MRRGSHGVINVVVVSDGALLAAQRPPRARAGMDIGRTPRASTDHARPGPPLPVCSVSLQLKVVELNTRRPPEQADRHPYLALVRDHLFDGPVEIRERTLGDRHRLTDEKRNL